MKMYLSCLYSRGYADDVEFNLAIQNVFLIDLESTGHQALEDAMWIVLLCNRDQPLVVLRAISGEDRLEPGRVTHIVESIVEASLLGGIVDCVRGLLHPFSNNLVICRSNPLDNLGIAKIDLGRIQSKCIASTSLRCLHPIGTNWLPVELNGGDIGLRNLLVQFRKLVEEGGVDDADSLVKLLVSCALDSSGNEDITADIWVSWNILRYREDILT